MELLETPGTSLEYLLEGLSEENTDELDPVFEELYSWYLRSQKYRELAESRRTRSVRVLRKLCTEKYLRMERQDWNVFLRVRLRIS